MSKLAFLAVFLFLFPNCMSSNKQPQPTRKWSLILVGGGNFPLNAKKEFIYRAGGKDANLVIICSASSSNDASTRSYEYWKQENTKTLYILNPQNPGETDKCCDIIKQATGLWISGGDQTRLFTIFKNTKALKEIKNLQKRGIVIGGTSAGASIASLIMMSNGNAEEGFGFLNHIIVDQHFSQRKREGRLMNLVKKFKDQIGLGIDEDTAILITSEEATVLGDGSVSLFTLNDTHKYNKGDKFALLP